MSWKVLGLCDILKKFAVDVYKIRLREGVNISPIFKAKDLDPYYEGQTSA